MIKLAGTMTTISNADITISTALVVTTAVSMTVWLLSDGNDVCSGDEVMCVEVWSVLGGGPGVIIEVIYYYNLVAYWPQWHYRGIPTMPMPCTSYLNQQRYYCWHSLFCERLMLHEENTIAIHIGIHEPTCVHKPDTVSVATGIVGDDWWSTGKRIWMCSSCSNAGLLST